MSRYFLAVSAVPLLSCFLVSPSCSQDNPLFHFTGSSIATAAQTPASSGIADEEMARLHMIRKEYKEAEGIFRRLAAENPKSALYWNELGIAYHNQSELDEALKCYQRAFKLDSKYADAENNVGTILYERKKYSKAIRAYRRAIDLRGDFAPFYLNLGYAYFNSKNFESSIAAFRRALELDPAALDPTRSRAGTIIQDRSVHAERGRFYYLLAKSFADAGDIERAIIYLRKSRDEGYAEFSGFKKDPSFAALLKDPSAEELLVPRTVETAQP